MRNYHIHFLHSIALSSNAALVPTALLQIDLQILE